MSGDGSSCSCSYVSLFYEVHCPCLRCAERGHHDYVQELPLRKHKKNCSVENICEDVSSARTTWIITWLKIYPILNTKWNANCNTAILQYCNTVILLWIQNASSIRLPSNALNIQLTALRPQHAFECPIWFSQETPVAFLHSVNQMSSVAGSKLH
jgi:hypothetical protein